jgi:hypothetical protein
VRVVSIPSAIAFVALNAFVALDFLFRSGGENQTSAGLHSSKFMALVGGALFILATATLIGVVREHSVLAIRAFVGQVALSVLALGYVLGGSPGYEGTAIFFALIIEVTGFAAIRLDFGPASGWVESLLRPN